MDLGDIGDGDVSDRELDELLDKGQIGREHFVRLLDKQEDHDLLVQLVTSHAYLTRDLKKVCKAQGESQSACSVLSGKVVLLESFPIRVEEVEKRTTLIENQMDKYRNRILGGYQFWTVIVAFLTLLFVLMGRFYDMGWLKPGQIP